MSPQGKEGTVLRHEISKFGIEVGKTKIEIIEKLSPPVSVKDIWSFLGHIGFSRWVIKDFSKILWLLTLLLEKDTHFHFD